MWNRAQRWFGRAWAQKGGGSEQPNAIDGYFGGYRAAQQEVSRRVKRKLIRDVMKIVEEEGRLGGASKVRNIQYRLGLMLEQLKGGPRGRRNQKEEAREGERRRRNGSERRRSSSRGERGRGEGAGRNEPGSEPGEHVDSGVYRGEAIDSVLLH